jgi:protein O-GlcNAc transferase
MNPQISFLLNKAVEALKISSLESANLYLKQAFKSQPKNPHILRLMGILHAQKKEYLEALECLNLAIKFDSKNALAYSNLGNVLNELRDFKGALAAYEQSIKLEPRYAEAWSNKGNTLSVLQRFEEALCCYEQSIKLEPRYAVAWSNKGNALSSLRRFEEALGCYDHALNLNPNYSEAWSNKGVILQELRRYDEAISCFSNALNLAPDMEWTHGDLFHAKMQVCDWEFFENDLQEIKTNIMGGKKVSTPFPLLSIIDSPDIHQRAAQIYVQSKFPADYSLGSLYKRLNNEKICIAYYSADYYNHATGHLISELFDRHDRSRFHIIGLSLGPSKNDEKAKRIANSFDQFIEVENKTDIEVASLSRDLGVDIAVDLKGFTQHGRPKIFAYRAAPIQVNYLGFPGTMGADYIDYIVADRKVISRESADFFTEKVISLPNSYQINDKKRIISDAIFSRSDFGLPEDGFVYCCFNNNYKILPETYDGWMRILSAVERSVLWLLSDNPWSQDNLKKQASKRGVDPARIIFAERMELSEHLARHRLADLFIDTFPYNAHTTASDSLWAGLPVLTMSGDSFPSRVAESLLSAIGLPELVLETQSEYEDMAIQLARSPGMLNDIKLKLSNNRLVYPLFDTPSFVNALESAYLKIFDLYSRGLPKEHILIN